MTAGYRRETLMLRAPGGARMGFVVWERGARQGSLRCHIEGLPAEQRFRLLWMAEGALALSGGGEIQSDASGAARQTLLLAGDLPLAGVMIASEDGTLCAQAFLGGREFQGPERLQALLSAEWEPPAPRTSAQVGPELDIKPDPDIEPVQATNQSRQPHTDESADLLRIEAAGQGYGSAWPPPPGLPGAVWRGGRWRLREGS